MPVSSQHVETNSIQNLMEIKEDLLQLLIDSKEYAVLLLDAKGYIRSWNMGAAFMYCYTTDEIVGQHFSCLYTEEGRETRLYQRHLQEVTLAGKIEVEEWGEKKNKEPFYVDTILTTLYHPDGSIKGFAKITRDISIQKKLKEENRQLHEQLEEKVLQRTKELAVANNELEAFSYSVSHDLRTPLRAIGGYAEMLKEDYDQVLDKEGHRILTNIIDNIRMMGCLIDDLLCFSRMSRMEVQQDAVNMNQVAAACIRELLQQWNEKAFDINVLPLPNCKGDLTMLKQVWINMIENAIKYSSKKEFPKIEIGATEDAQNIVYYIKDNGTGFDMKYAGKLFGVFQRLHRQDEFEGTGVGLALARRIISKHGGDIWAEAALHQGATFYFSIPKKLIWK